MGDLEGKSARNVICPTLGGELLYCVRGESGDWSETVFPLPFGLKAGKGVAISDVNLDGRPDLVTTSESQREADDMVSVAWKENSPSGWTDHAISDKHGRKFDRIENAGRRWRWGFGLDYLRRGPRPRGNLVRKSNAVIDTRIANSSPQGQKTGTDGKAL